VRTQRLGDRAIAAADSAPDKTVIRELADEIDLHDKLMKGLYEIGAARLPGPPTVINKGCSGFRPVRGWL